MTCAPTDSDTPNDVQRTALALGTCSASLPDDFTIEVTERDFMMLGFAETKRMEQSWIEVRCELNRRGYTVHEWTDDARMVRCARCFKPNTEISNSGHQPTS